MNAQTLYREGRLGEAIQAAGAQLRDDPSNQQLRTFLFELLCFAGEYDRAEKQLDVLAQGDKDREVGVLLYRGALAAEQTREDMFAKGNFPLAPANAKPVGGTLNGRPFESIEDADPRVGARLELFAAGNYMWIPFEHVSSLTMEAPKRLRDLLWAEARLATGPDCQLFDLGEILIPVLSPRSCRHSDEQVRLGRMTVWEQEEGPVPYGQKILLVDGEEVPLLEVRTLTIGPPASGEADAVE